MAFHVTRISMGSTGSRASITCLAIEKSRFLRSWYALKALPGESLSADMKSCTVGLLSDACFPAFIREIMVFRWFFHMCLRTALRKLVLAVFLVDAWLRMMAPQILHLPIMVVFAYK
ncbi:hypothetical protein ES708_28110 [subsurface metagenome]